MSLISRKLCQQANVFKETLLCLVNINEYDTIISTWKM